MSQEPIARQRLRLEGFELIDETLTFLVECLGDALKGLGEDKLLPYLPWSDQEVPDERLQGVRFRWRWGKGGGNTPRFLSPKVIVCI